jgi:hypothetical protein
MWQRVEADTFWPKVYKAVTVQCGEIGCVIKRDLLNSFTFNDGISGSGYKPSNCQASEQSVGKRVYRKGLGLIWGNIFTSTWRNCGKPRRISFRKVVSRLRFEPVTYTIRVRSVTACANFLGKCVSRNLMSLHFLFLVLMSVGFLSITLGPIFLPNYGKSVLEKRLFCTRL